MRTTLLLLAVAACSSSPAPARRVAATSPPDRPPAPVVADAGAAHRCVASVVPYYDPEGVADETSEAWPDDMPGATLDDKLAELNRRRPDAGVCDTRHREALEDAILARPAPRTVVTPAAAKGPAAYTQLVTTNLALTADEQQRLRRDGMVVPERLAYPDYTRAYYDIHRSQLPVFVSVDSILHAVFIAHEQLLGTLEGASMIERLDRVLGAMHCGLVAAAPSFPPEVAADLDLYLTVARRLLANDDVPAELDPATTSQAARIIELIETGNSTDTIMLFGRERALDTSQFTPRGHYEGGELQTYFRAAMWLSRVEMNLVSRDSRSSQPGDSPDPRETPREAVVALAIADLAERSGALDDVTALDRAWGALAGKREDISIAQLLELRAKAGITDLRAADVPARLRTAIGAGFQRSVNVHPMPNVARLPAIMTILGPRITSDHHAVSTLIEERGPSMQGVELGYVLGHDRALAHLPKDGALRARLDAARGRLASTPPDDSLYTSWLTAIRALAERPTGAQPSFMDRDVYKDMRLGSAITAYGQLKHNHVLISAQVYDQGGCEIPDGYVEPAPATYKALADYARRGKDVFAALDPKDQVGGVAYYTRLEKLMRVLEALSLEQLAGRPLSREAKRFLAMIVEQRGATAQGYMQSFPVATFDGWYVDLFPDIDSAISSASFIADYATFNRDGAQGIHYLGAKQPRLGVFLVDAGGAPRLMVGPVANGFQYTGRLDVRLDDSMAESTAGQAPWAASYTAPAQPFPAMTVEFRRTARERDRSPDRLPPNTLQVEAPSAVGKVRVDFLDHHFATMKTIDVTVGEGRVRVKAPKTKRPIEGIRLRIGDRSVRLATQLDGSLREEL